jgi:hypothetical protein
MKKPVVITLLVLLAACGQQAETLPNGEEKVSPDIINNPATASESGDTTKGPVFNFAETRHHFGEIAEGEKVSYVFRFTNGGKADLVIANVSASCGCTAPEWPREPIPPGGEGHIKVTFDSQGKPGMQSKTVTVIANTTPATRVLTISAEVLAAKKQ